MGGAERVARALGTAHREGRGWRCFCPLHGGYSLVIRDGDEGRLLVRCWGGACDPGDILAKLRRRGLLGDAPDDHHHRTGPNLVRGNDAAHRIALARKIWETALDARGTPAAAYLAGRAITTPPTPSLRWAPRCWHRETRAELPAMIAAVLDLNGRLIGVHRTYLEHDETGTWRRRDRASLGPIGGGAVHLAPAAETMLVGEGIETVLAAMQATTIPGWAALSTSGMTALVLPPIMRTVIVLADNDVNGAGQRAAYAAAQRWLAEGRRVRVAIPPEPGTDFNDVLAGHGYPPIEEGSHAAA